MAVVACISDLFFQSKVVETARHLDLDLAIADSESKLDEVIRKNAESAFIVDLCFGNAQGVGLVKRIRRELPEARLVAFAPHVEEDLLEAARQAGATDVMSRAKFTKRLSEILTCGG
jgi:DNA-binding NarL/FixJ family response regulator